MQIVKTVPKKLSGLIKCFYIVRAGAMEHTGVAQRRLPDGTLDIVFNLGAPVLLSRDGYEFSEMPAVSLTGLYQERKFIRHTGAVHLVGAVFQPGQGPLFLNDSLIYYEECVLDATLIFGDGIRLLSEKLLIAVNDDERLCLLEHFLSSYLRNGHDNYYAQKIAGAVHQIHALEGNVAMPTLYKDSFMSERNFRRRFAECVGINPKRYATIVRVKSFSKRKATHTAHMDFAYDLGYTDASHVNKDFQKIAGIAPTAYFSQLNNIGAEFIHLI